MSQKRLQQESRENYLEYYARQIESELQRARSLVERKKQGENIPDFDIRGRLYELALELAPNARHEDLEMLKEWIEPREGEVCVDIAAGTGFVTHALESWVGGQGRVYAIDPSHEQLQALEKNCSARAETVLGSPDDDGIFNQIPEGSIDLVTSFGGIHHVAHQEKMFANIAKLLKVGGRFVAGDVCANTTLARHFDTFVADKCLTGHSANWLDESRLEELSAQAGLHLVKSERISLSWKFKNRRELTLFFKGLHAYDLSEEEVLADLQSALGFTEAVQFVRLHWPMIFFDIRK